MKEVGPTHVIQVVMDNASNNKIAANNLRSAYPHVVFTNCAAHCLDVMLHDLGNIPAVKRVLGQVHRVVMMVKGSASAVILFHELFSKLSLVRPGATRFGTQVIMLGKFLEVKRALRAVVISQEWEEVAVARTEEGMEYMEEVKNDPEIRKGADEVIQARGGDVSQRITLAAQLAQYHSWLSITAGSVSQLAQYHRGEGRLGSDDARWTARTLVEGGRMTDAEWWTLFGGEVQALQEQAVMVLSQPVTSSEVERYWSALQRVQRRDRNRLTAKKMPDVTIVAFIKRARDAFDQKAAVRARLYADLGNSTLKEGCAIISAESEDEEGEAEEELSMWPDPARPDPIWPGHTGPRVHHLCHAWLQHHNSTVPATPSPAALSSFAAAVSAAPPDQSDATGGRGEKCLVQQPRGNEEASWELPVRLNVSHDALLAACARLAESHLLLAEGSALHCVQRIQLNLPREDVLHALSADQELPWLSRHLG
ncbi:unnamed protein product [Closterium sp. NIES-64]|nr:unnamed protein product [Closterium sp. NIES-64]